MNIRALIWRISQINQFWKFQISEGWSPSEIEHLKAARIFGLHGAPVQPVREHVNFLLKQAPPVLKITDFGAVSGVAPVLGSAQGIFREVSTLKMLSQTASSEKWGRLLLRFAQMKAGEVNLELGTNLGVGLRYLVTGTFFQHRWISIEGDPVTADLAISAFGGNEQIDVVNGRFVEVLPKILQENSNFGLVFIDGHHDGLATQEYADLISPKLKNNGWLILDDIRWSASMKSAWEELKKRSWVDRWVDLGKMGILVVK